MTRPPEPDARRAAIERNDRRRLHRLARARATFQEGDDFLMTLAVDDMMDRLDLVTRRFEDAAALFGLTDALRDALRGRVGRVHDVVPENGLDDLGLDPQSLDLVCAPLALHHVVDLPGVLVQVRRALRPDGLLLASLPGPATLNELREALLGAEAEITGGAAQRVDAFAEVRDAGALLQRAGFALPVADTTLHTVRYDAMDGLVRDLRRMGATHGAPRFASRRVFERAAALYAERSADPDGRIRATFEIVSMSGWAPHESQQKPLRPGSAKARLADALSVDETPLKR